MFFRSRGGGDRMSWHNLGHFPLLLNLLLKAILFMPNKTLRQRIAQNKKTPKLSMCVFQKLPIRLLTQD